MRPAFADGCNRQARRGMLLASMISELAANSTRPGLCHPLAIPIGARHHVPHGLANAILLATVADLNVGADPDRYGRIALALDGTTDAGLAIANLRGEIVIADRLSNWSVTSADFKELTETALRNDNVEPNHRVAGANELAIVLRASR